MVLRRLCRSVALPIVQLENVVVALDGPIDAYELSLQANGHDIHIDVDRVVTVVASSKVSVQRLRKPVVQSLCRRSR